jgi:hypothetical protein
MAMVDLLDGMWLSGHSASKHPKAAARQVPNDLEQQPTVRSSLPDGPGGDPSCLGGHLVGFTLNTKLIILPLCFMYPMAFRALLNVFVIRVPIESH